MKKTWLYAFLGAIFGALVTVIFRIRVKGKENIPKEGGCIVCSNHVSLMDIPTLVHAIPRQLHFMAKAELFRSKIGKWFFQKKLKAIPVNRGANDINAMYLTVKEAKKGNMVAIFPQGTRCVGENPANTEIKGGVGMIAYRANVPVLPVCIKTKGQKFRFLQRTEVIIGAPMTKEQMGFTKGGSEEYDKAAAYIFDSICALGGFEKGKDLAQ